MLIVWQKKRRYSNPIWGLFTTKIEIAQRYENFNFQPLPLGLSSYHKKKPVSRFHVLYIGKSK